jgi:DNA polymerase-3 subunit delta'
MIWTSIRGHAAQIEMFRRAVQRGRTAHAYVFIGPDGIGKRLVAQTIAQCLFCERVPNDRLDACGECHACRQIRAGTHPDLLAVACPEGKRELPIALIAGPDGRRGQEGLCHDLALHPMSAPQRIAIIDDADAMNEESANALLKTLEEPPPGSILFLISPSLDALLPTIRSRCQPVHFAPLAPGDIADLIVDLGWETDRTAAETVAALSDGSLATVRRLLDPQLRQLRDQLYERLAERDMKPLAVTDAILSALDDIAGDTAAQRESATWVVQFAVEFFRQALHELPDGADPEQADVLAAQLDRCLLADLHLQQTMPVPLCVEGLFDDLARMRRGAVPV